MATLPDGHGERCGIGWILKLEKLASHEDTVFCRLF